MVHKTAKTKYFCNLNFVKIPKPSLILLAIGFLFFFSPSQVKAQTAYDLVANGDGVEQSLSLQNTSGAPLKDIEIEIKLPAGVSILSSSLDLFNTGLGAGTSYSLLRSTSTGIVIKLNGTFPNNETAVIKFKRMASCVTQKRDGLSDEAFVVSNTSISTFSKDYSIWEPIMHPTSTSSSVPSGSAIVGQEVNFLYDMWNSGLNSYVSNFYIYINHAGFDIPTNVVLKRGDKTVSIATSDISTAGTNSVKFKVTSTMLTALGLTDGRAYTNDEVGLTFTAVPTIASCGSLVSMKISTQIENCSKITSASASDVNLNITSPGTILSTFTVERKQTSFDFPDSNDSRTRNGAWDWDGGNASPLKDQVRNGDTLEIKLKGSVYTSSLFPQIGQIYADIYVKNAAALDTYNEFTWSSLLAIRTKDTQNSWTESTVMADVTINNGYVRYKIGVTSNTKLESGGEVELVITAIMKNTATDNTLCKFSADMYATKSQGLPASGYPTTACRSRITDIPIKRVVITDKFKVETLGFTASCTAAKSSIKFTSSESSMPSVSDNNYFTQEFRGNHYIKELQVYIPSEGTLNSGSVTFNGVGTPVSLTVPSHSTVSFTANATVYADAKLYTFDISALYGDYDNATSKFVDEYPHELLFDFDVAYSNNVGGSGQASSILYVATPVNPSAPSAILAPMSDVQAVLLPAIAPVLAVNGASNVGIVGGKATWALSLSNPNDAADISNASLKIENITGGSFKNLEVKLNGNPVSVSSDGIAQLGNINRNTINTITVEATIDQACSKTEEVVATLRYEPCGAAPENISFVQLSFETPKSTVQVSSTPSATKLKMCEVFTVKVKINASEGVVYEPKAVLEFPKNSAGAIGVTLEGIRIKGKSYPEIGSGLGSGVLGGIENIEFDLKDIVGGPKQLDALDLSNRELEIEVDLKPNCDFPIDAKLTSYAYGRNYCNDYNSLGSGVPIYTDVLTIDGLQSSYEAEVKFDKSLLKFDKRLNEKTAVLSVKMSSAGGTVGANDNIALTMPASLKLATYPAGFISDNIVGSGTSAVRIVTWKVPTTLSMSTPTDYSLTFVMENPAAYTDLLRGAISAVVVNKVAGLPCPGQPNCLDMEVKAGESSMAFEIVDLFPALAKDVSYKANSLLSYSFTYTFTLKNFGTLVINNVRLQDDLKEFHSKGSVSKIKVVPSSTSLVANTAYNGNTNIELLTLASKLLANETQTVTLTFDVLFKDAWKNKTFTIGNTAVFIGSNENNTDYEDKSNNGTDPDLTDETPTETDPINTNPPEVEVVPIVTIPPAGFAITSDGVECFEGDSGTTTPLEFEYRLKDGIPLDYDLCFTVYTRDSIATVADNDYKKVPPTVVCIKAGNITADKTVTVDIIGDDKYEKDEPFILDAKSGADAMTCKPPVITILNDDDIPTIVIDDVDQPTKEPNLSIPNIGNLYQLEGTSTTARTEFQYCVKLNAAAPQDLVLKVVIGNDDDTAVKGRDYYSDDVITKDIPAGNDEVCFMIEVEPDDIPENNEYFTMSFSLEVDGVEFYQEVKKAYIIDDDELTTRMPGEALVYCPGDDATERSRKLNAYVSTGVPAGYELRWYANQTTGTQIAEPLMESAQPGDVGTYYLGLYSFDENYETPVGKRAVIGISIQTAPQVTVASTPASPMTLFSGQTVSFAVTPLGLLSYDFILNGTSLTSGPTSQNEVTVHRDKFTYTNVNTYTANTMEVVMVDSEGCSWNESYIFDAKQVELPNAFIPEGPNPDNQLFLKGYDIKVFNRWGHLLYEGTEGWDGRYKGTYVAAGTYYYVVYITQEDGNVVEEKGFVMVVSATKK